MVLIKIYLSMDLKKFHSQMKDDQGRYRTQSLFWELRYKSDESYIPIFTLKEDDITRDGIVYYSLKKIYMSYDHVPQYEYEFAKDVFNSWDHWIKLTNSLQAIKDEIQSWRDELDIRLKAQALKAMIYASRDNDAKGVQASRYLAEKGYEVKRGRPSKEEIEREKKIQAGASKELQDDIERIGLKIVNGGNKE